MLFSRREAVLAAAALGGAVGAQARPSRSNRPVMMLGNAVGNGLHDFAFQTGEWRVRHRKLRRRLVADTEWLEFDGTCLAWELMGGAGNLDDHFLDDPNGPYRAATVRQLDPVTGRWSIYWLDGRRPKLDPPVHGRFENGAGLFIGEDELDGRPITVRFRWLDIRSDSALWEQAFSADRGDTWEVNWKMAFERVR